MTNNHELKVFLVDDDAVFLKLLEIELHKHPGFNTESYKSGELCIKNIWHNPDVVVLDYHLNGVDKNAMNGLDVLHKIKDFNQDIQVIILSQQDTIDIAIKAIQHKAIDYVVKSETSFLRILNIVTTVLNFKKIEKGVNWYSLN